MSTKALREALDYLENNPTANEAQDARRRARKELEAIEQAADAWAESEAGTAPKEVHDLMWSIKGRSL